MKFFLGVFSVLLLISKNLFCVVEKKDDPIAYFNEEYSKYSTYLSHGRDGWYGRRPVKRDRRVRYATYINGKLMESQRRHLIFNDMMKQLQKIDYFNAHGSLRKYTENLKKKYVISYSNTNINNNEDYLIDDFIDLFMERLIEEISSIIKNVLNNTDWSDINGDVMILKYNTFLASDYYNKLVDLHVWAKTKGLLRSKKERFKSHEREMFFLCSRILKIKKLMQGKPQQTA